MDLGDAVTEFRENMDLSRRVAVCDSANDLGNRFTEALERASLFNSREVCPAYPTWELSSMLVL